MPIRNCPVCRIGRIVRKDVKTCGAPDCVELWKHMSTSQRARAIEEADETFEISALPKPTFDKSAISPAPAPDSTTQRDNEALERIFGAGAPGIMKPTDEKDKDKE